MPKKTEKPKAKVKKAKASKPAKVKKKPTTKNTPKKFYCEECKRQFKNGAGFYSHNRSKHGDGTVNLGGRKTKYKSEYCEKLIEFFVKEPVEYIEIPHYYANGQIKWIDKKRIAPKLPTLLDFAKENNIGITTVYDWVDQKHSSFKKEFSDTFTRMKQFRKWFLVQNALAGIYNPAFSIFTAKNITNMTDTSDLNVTNMNKFKDLSDEELKIAIETGKLPARFNEDE